MKEPMLSLCVGCGKQNAGTGIYGNCAADKEISASLEAIDWASADYKKGVYALSGAPLLGEGLNEISLKEAKARALRLRKENQLENIGLECMESLNSERDKLRKLGVIMREKCTEGFDPSEYGQISNCRHYEKGPGEE